MRWSKVRNLIIQLTAGQPIMKIPICYKSMRDFQLTTCQYTRGYGYCLPKNSTLDFVWLPWWLPFPQIHFPSQVLLVPLCKCPKRQQTPPKRWSKVGKMQRQGGQWHFSWKHATKTRRKEIQKILYVGSWLRFPCLRFFYQKGKSEILKGLLLYSYLAESKYSDQVAHILEGQISPVAISGHAFSYHLSSLLQVREVAALDRAGPGGAERGILFPWKWCERKTSKNFLVNQPMVESDTFCLWHDVIFCKLYQFNINLWPFLRYLILFWLLGLGIVIPLEPFVI